MLLFLAVVVLTILFVVTTNAQSFKIVVPDIPGIEVKVGESVTIPTEGQVKTAQAFQFEDGRIVTGNGKNSMWSYDNGYTWKTGTTSQIDKTALDLGNGEILSIE